MCCSSNDCWIWLHCLLTIRYWISQFLNSFGGGLWISIAGMLMLFSLLYFFATFPQRNWKNFQKSIWNIFSIFLQQGPSELNSTVGQKMITGAWSVFSILIISTWVVKLKVTRSTPLSPVRDINNLRWLKMTSNDSRWSEMT